VTLDVDARPAAPPASRTTFRNEAVPAAAAAVAWLGLVAVSVRAGGRDPHALLVGLAALVPALLVLRPGRNVPLRAWAVAAAVPLAAAVSCAASPRGWAGAGDVALWTYAALLFLVTRAYATTTARKTAVALAVAALGVHQVNAALIPWLGGGDPGRPMIGTFYWHNQFAAWTAAAALAGGAAALLGRRYVALAGGAAFGVCATGVLLSTSRATLALLALAWLALGAAAVRARRTRGAARWAAASLAVPLLATLLTGPLAFDAGGSALGATGRRAAAESVSGNAAYRLDYWRAAVAVTAEHPLTGTGAGGYRTAALDHLPAGMQGSPYVHNGLLQAFAEGGLPLGLALAAAVSCAAWTCLRRSREALRANDFARLGLAAAALVLMAHALVDFDTAYAALPALAALAVGGLGAVRPVTARAATRPAHRVPTAAVAALLLLGLGAAALDDAVRATAGRVRPGDAVAARDAFSAEALPDARVGAAVLNAAAVDGRLTLPEDVVRRALRETATLTGVDAALALRRLAVEALLGDHTAADRAAAVVATRRERRPFLVTLYAEVLIAANRPDGSTEVRTEVERRAVPGYARPAEVWDLVGWLIRRGTAQDAGCAVTLATKAFGPPPEALGAVTGWRSICGVSLVAQHGKFSAQPAPPKSQTTPAPTARRHRP
jgi:O-antigen ligase